MQIPLLPAQTITNPEAWSLHLQPCSVPGLHPSELSVCPACSDLDGASLSVACLRGAASQSPDATGLWEPSQHRSPEGTHFTLITCLVVFPLTPTGAVCVKGQRSAHLAHCWISGADTQTVRGGMGGWPTLWFWGAAPTAGVQCRAQALWLADLNNCLHCRVFPAAPGGSTWGTSTRGEPSSGITV